MDRTDAPPLAREGTLSVALLLAFAGGYIDAYTWMLHGVLANGQSANVVFLWVHAMARRWEEAFRYVPPILAFTVGVVAASWLRRSAGRKAGETSLLIEILMLVTVGVLHNRLPDLAGTLGISFVAAIQTSIFIKVEGLTYSSVMVTGNLRQAIEGAFEAVSDGREPGRLRPAYIFTGLCAAFGTGAAVGALLTEWVPALTLGVPITVLLVVLLRCATGRVES
jgi:uncharacterized membrane protein YoaK (UPF0700 family)